MGTQFDLDKIRENARGLSDGLDKIAKHFDFPDSLTGPNTLGHAVVNESRAMASALEAARNALHHAKGMMTTDARDWSVDPKDAWLYGIFVGWNDDALTELQEKHGWSSLAVGRLHHLRASIAALEKPDA